MSEILKILKLAKYGDQTGKTKEEEDALLKKHNARRLTPSEWMALPEASTLKGGEYYDYWPCRLEENGLVSRGGVFFFSYGRRHFRRVVVCGHSATRFGVLATPINKRSDHPSSKTKKDGVEYIREVADWSNEQNESHFDGLDVKGVFALYEKTKDYDTIEDFEDEMEKN